MLATQFFSTTDNYANAMLNINKHKSKSEKHNLVAIYSSQNCELLNRMHSTIWTFEFEVKYPTFSTTPKGRFGFITVVLN